MAIGYGKKTDSPDRVNLWLTNGTVKITKGATDGHF